MNARPLRPVMSVDEVNSFLDEAFPQLNGANRDYEAISITPGACVVRLHAGYRHLRPGDTVSGPALFTLADIGGYVCVLSHTGPEALSVTTNLNINFMRKATAGPIDGHCRILKLGKSLMVFDIDMRAGAGLTVAHATGTYAIPPKHVVT
ncbi:PaaI family thioesterase [Tianweitania sediminis]|uniref:PaaI family thioesterase n=1 Tax=Tianweitania sediminis TaxID=1502156 RepID=A0A8J7RM04_9HYPH|nr:PaaI family thioesterase [Tianweitania sediminis]MBP0439641.1 PaaI family thioesterase [Tianweitania sediminis]